VVIVALVALGLVDLDGDEIVVGMLAGDKAFVSSAGTVLRQRDHHRITLIGMHTMRGQDAIALEAQTGKTCGHVHIRRVGADWSRTLKDTVRYIIDTCLAYSQCDAQDFFHYPIKYHACFHKGLVHRHQISCSFVKPICPAERKERKAIHE
jgi:hypothetical protein